MYSLSYSCLEAHASIMPPLPRTLPTLPLFCPRFHSAHASILPTLSGCMPFPPTVAHIRHAWRLQHQKTTCRRETYIYLPRPTIAPPPCLRP